MNKPIRVAIVDDEPDAVASIELIIKEFCNDIEVVATANLIDKAWDLIKSTEPDHVF
jgi:YesN/AraC family two-component response regulator